MRTPAWCRRQATAIGPACEQVIAGLLADSAATSCRSTSSSVFSDAGDRPSKTSQLQSRTKIR